MSVYGTGSTHKREHMHTNKQDGFRVREKNKVTNFVTHTQAPSCTCVGMCIRTKTTTKTNYTNHFHFSFFHFIK